MQTLWMDIDENMQPCEYGRRRRNMNTMNGGSAEKMTDRSEIRIAQNKDEGTWHGCLYGAYC